MTWKEELDALIARVEKNTTIRGGIDMLLNGVANIAGTVKADAGAVQDFANSLKEKAAVAANAVVANVPGK